MSDEKHDLVTDAHVGVWVHSANLSFCELQERLSAEATYGGDKGLFVRPNGREVVLDKTLYVFSTEKLLPSKDLNEHVRVLADRFGDMSALNALVAEGAASVRLKVTWWTKEPLSFALSGESLRTLGRVTGGVDFSLAVYPD